MTPTPLSVRQLGPSFARCVARHTRYQLAIPACALIADSVRALRSRLGLRLRRVEAQRIAARFLAEAKPLALAPIERGPGFAFATIVPIVDRAGLHIGRFCFDAPADPDGGFVLAIRFERLAYVTVHALERMHLRLSTVSFDDIAPVLRELAHMDVLAPAARAAALRWMWLPSGADCAFVVAFDADVPRVVSYLDALSHPRAALIEPLRSWLRDPAADAAQLERILRRGELDLWRRGRERE
jgi:hypothetical protein